MKISLCSFGIHKHGEWEPIQGNTGNECETNYIYQKRQCFVCNKIQTNKVKIKNSHEFSKWMVVRNTALSVGDKNVGWVKVYERTCKTCGEVRSKVDEQKLEGY